MAAAQNLDQLLSAIKADISAKRLSSPAGNNALERIETFRAQAPYDYRVVPLAYEWGEAYVALANKAMDGKDYRKAQEYLDNVWFVAALTPGLEAAQARLDSVYTAAPTAVASKTSSKAEQDRQRQLAEAAEKEKARIEAERKRRAEEERRLAAAEQKKAEQERLRRQQEERQRRAEAERSEQQAEAQRQTAARQAPAAPAPVVSVAVSSRTQPEVSGNVTAMWDAAEESSPAIARYDLAADLIDRRDRAISATLEPVCSDIIAKDASVVIHTDSVDDYRWLTVRLTLCLRRQDKDFRLRHSHQADQAGAGPFVTLHPPRDSSLMRQVSVE